MLEVVFKRKEKDIEKQQKRRANLASFGGFLFCAYHLMVFHKQQLCFEQDRAVQKSQSYCCPILNSAMKWFCVV